MWHKTKSFLRESADEFSTEGQDNGAPEEFTFEPEQQHSTDNQQQGVSHGSFDYEALARANASVLAPVLEKLAPKQVQNQQFSQEEFDKLTKKFTPDEVMAKAMFGENATPEQIKALQAYTNGIYQHLYASTGLALKSELEPIRGELTPLKQAQMEQKQRAFENDLVTNIPALKPFGQLVSHAVAVLKQQGYSPQGSTPAEQRKHAFTTVARFVEAQVRMTQPNFSLKAASQSGGSGKPRMATMTNNGGGNSGNGGSGGKKPAWMSVLGA